MRYTLQVTVDRLLWLEMLSGTACRLLLAGSNSRPAGWQLDKEGGRGGCWRWWSATQSWLYI